jgi:hypothetical protein
MGSKGGVFSFWFSVGLTGLGWLMHLGFLWFAYSVLLCCILCILDNGYDGYVFISYCRDPDTGTDILGRKDHQDHACNYTS